MALITGQNTPKVSQYTADQFVGNGTTTVFTLSRTPPTPTSLIVTIDGVKQNSSTYSIGVNQIIFSEAPPNGSSIETLLLGVVGNVNEVPDGSVTAQKIVAGAVTRPKYDIDGTGAGALALPYGPAVLRPSTTVDLGQIRYNTDTGLVEGYHGSSYGWVALSNLSLPGRLLSVQTFIPKTNPGNPDEISSSSGSYNWTKPAGCNNVLVYVTGGGGGARNNDNAYRGAGGGGGGTAIKYIDVSSVSNVTVTVGGGGAAARGSGRGATGGTSSFGSYCSATGGRGGQTDAPYEGGLGGYATGGDVNIPGGGGEMAHGADREGGGGSSFWHKSGSNHQYTTTDSSMWIIHGQWGSGGGNGYYTQNWPQYGNGGSGVVVVFNYT